MTLRRWLFPVNRWLEPSLAIAVVASIAWSIIHLFTQGYLPQPFFYEPSDMWMDWFNTAYWGHNPGAYDTWGTIYPPLSFVILRFLTDGSCYVGGGGLESRNCDWFGAVTLHAVFVVNLVLLWKTFRKIDRTTALPRTVALGIGLPMAYGLERGNLILLAFTFMLLAFGPLVRSARLRWLFAGLAVNLKVYLVASIFAQLVLRRWRWFEGALVATILVYLVSYAMLGAGTPMEIYRNIADYSSGFQSVSLLDLWYAGTYKPLISLLNGDVFPIVGVVGSRPVEVANLLIPVLINAVQATILLAAALAWCRPEGVPPHRIVLQAIGMALITAESGGYTQILLILFVFMEPWRGFGRKWAIIAAYLLCIAGDIPIENVPPSVHESFVAGGPIIAEYTVGIGPFIRPLLIMSLPFALALVTIRETWGEVRVRGLADLWHFRSNPLRLGSSHTKAAASSD
jgi:hypothetical protein